jgi:hypothetical protein
VVLSREFIEDLMATPAERPEAGAAEGEGTDDE